MTALLDFKFERAEVFLDAAFSRFLSIWAESDPLMTDSRRRHLTQLQRLREMREFMEVISGGGGEGRRLEEEKLECLVETWSRRALHPTRDAVADWQTAIQDRLCCLRLGLNAVGRRRGDDADDGRGYERLASTINHFERQSLLDLAAAGLSQNSLDLVSGILGTLITSHPNVKNDPQFLFLRAKLVIDSYHSGCDRKRNVNKALRSFCSSESSSSSSSSSFSSSSSSSSSSAPLLRLRGDLFEVAYLQIRHCHVTQADKSFGAIFDTLRAYGVNQAADSDPSAALLHLAIDSHRLVSRREKYCSTRSSIRLHCPLLLAPPCTMGQNQVILRHQKFTFPRSRE